MPTEVETAQRYFQSWNERDMDALEAVLALDHRFNGVIRGRESTGAGAFRGIIEGYFKVFPDIQFEIEHIFGSNGWAAARVWHRGTHLGEGWPLPPLGKKYELPVHHHLRIVDGKVAEAFEQWDRTAVREMLAAP